MTTTRPPMDDDNDDDVVMMDGHGIEQWLEMACLSFVDPISGTELVRGGSSMDITLENLSEYTEAVLHLWLNTGITRQVEAFRRGLNDVIRLDTLRLFDAHELLDLIRGSTDVDWDRELLLSSIQPGHGYDATSGPFLNLIDTLDNMSPLERREFLLFATGCPSLPPGGLAKLSPSFEVVRRQISTTQRADDALPFARTCTNTLHLPSYSTKDRLAERLNFAVQNSKGIIDRD